MLNCQGEDFHRTAVEIAEEQAGSEGSVSDRTYWVVPPIGFDWSLGPVVSDGAGRTRQFYLTGEAFEGVYALLNGNALTVTKHALEVANHSCRIGFFDHTLFDYGANLTCDRPDTTEVGGCAVPWRVSSWSETQHYVKNSYGCIGIEAVFQCATGTWTVYAGHPPTRQVIAEGTLEEILER